MPSNSGRIVYHYFIIINYYSYLLLLILIIIVVQCFGCLNKLLFLNLFA